MLDVDSRSVSYVEYTELTCGISAVCICYNPAHSKLGNIQTRGVTVCLYITHILPVYHLLILQSVRYRYHNLYIYLLSFI